MSAPTIARRASPAWVPPPTVRVDRSHPLGQGLVALFLCNSGAPRDLLTGLRLTPTAAALSTSNGLVAAANDAKASITTPGHLRLNQEFSFACGFMRLPGTPAGGSGLFGTTYTNADTSPYSGWMFDSQSSGVITLASNDGGSNASGVSSSNVASVGHNVATGVVEAGSVTVMLNDGAPVSTGRGALPTLHANSLLFIGAYPVVNNRNPCVSVQWAAVWARKLTRADHAMLRVDPYCMLRF